MRPKSLLKRKPSLLLYWTFVLIVMKYGPVARILAARGVPFVFSTGHYDRESLPTEWSDRPILTKPVGRQKIVAALTEVILRH